MLAFQVGDGVRDVEIRACPGTDHRIDALFEEAPALGHPFRLALLLDVFLEVDAYDVTHGDRRQHGGCGGLAGLPCLLGGVTALAPALTGLRPSGTGGGDRDGGEMAEHQLMQGAAGIA